MVNAPSLFALSACLLSCTLTIAQTGDVLSAQAKKYVSVSSPKIVLTHVRVIDGTGAAPVDDQNITIEGGKVTAISPGQDLPGNDGATILNLKGYSVMPGIVGMHDHLYYIAFPNAVPGFTYDSPTVSVEMSYSAPRLYLANGVTTIRTAGSANPYTDLRLRQAIEAGTVPGPHMDVTSPYLQGAGPSSSLQNRELTDPDDARQTVAYWAERGVTSFKAYTQITREELRAVVAEAHERGLKVTGHLCSVTYDEAVEAGIDNLEHGFSANTANDPDKKPDTCSTSGGDYTLEHMTPDSSEAKHLISLLVSHHVAVTSTLPNLGAAVDREAVDVGQPLIPKAAMDAMSPSARQVYLYWRDRPKPVHSTASLLQRREMDLERSFVAAGGLLLAGPDPVGIGGNLPGFGDHREIELLVEAGFKPVEAIRIATLNGAIFLGREKHIGSVAVGKNADLLVVKGDPAARIEDVHNVELVFKDGVGYDPKKLLDAAKGHYGDY
jgi:imidazolonepropionase-like amidohydrolase